MNHTDNDLQIYIRKYLKTITPLSPIPTGIEPRTPYIPGIKIIMFDIYGTVLISDSGDIDSCDLGPLHAAESFKECGITLLTDDERDAGRHITEEYRNAIRASHSHEKTNNNASHPEVNIVEIWETVVNVLKEKHIISYVDEPDYYKLAFTFEIRNNPVYPMPGTAQCIETLSSGPFRLGFVSNSQFFSPIILNYFISGTVRISKKVDFFDMDLSLYSYQFKRAKPDPKLFDIAHEHIAAYNVKPEEVLFIGNDMLNDVYAADRAGFKTVLFAGDKRSLRMRTDIKRVQETTPDAVITELKQLNDIVIHKGHN